MSTEMTEGTCRAHLRIYRQAKVIAACTAGKAKWAAHWKAGMPKDNIVEHVYMFDLTVQA